MRLQKFFARQIVLPLLGKTVMAAIQFNVQFRLLAKEIQIVITDGMFAAEFVIADPAVAQPAAQQLFRPGFNLAELAGALRVGHDGNLRNHTKAAKLVSLLALTCVLSPRERITHSRFCLVPTLAWQIQPRDFSKRIRRMAFLVAGCLSEI